MASTRFTLRQLEIFATVVRTGQVKRAAAALHLSQAAVSQALHELGYALGVTLFERDGRRIIATAAARQLLRLAAEPMAALTAIPGQLTPRDRSAALTGHIRLAASSTIARYVLPRALAGLRSAHPGLAITVLSGNSAVVERRVAELDADIGFIEGPARREDIEVRAWRTDALQIIAPPDYQIADIRLDQLDAHAWVAREPGSGTRAVFEQSLAIAGYAAPHAELVIDDSGAIVRAVAAGAGLACVSRLAAVQAAAKTPVQHVNFAPLSLERPLWQIRRATPAHSPVIENFLHALDGKLGANGRT